MKKLWKFYWDCGRMGNLEGAFVATEEDVQSAIGKHIYFGEVLGKHSEIYGDLDADEIVDTGAPSGVIAWFEEFFPEGFGYNPLNYLPEEDEEDEEDDSEEE